MGQPVEAADGAVSVGTRSRRRRFSGARGEGKAREFGAAIQNELDFAVANSVANPMNLTALNVRVANTWKRKIRR